MRVVPVIEQFGEDVEKIKAVAVVPPDAESAKVSPAVVAPELIVTALCLTPIAKATKVNTVEVAVSDKVAVIVSVPLFVPMVQDVGVA